MDALQEECDSLRLLRAEALRDPGGGHEAHEEPGLGRGWVIAPVVLAATTGVLQSSWGSALGGWLGLHFWSLTDPYLLGGLVAACTLMTFFSLCAVERQAVFCALCAM